MGPNGKDPAYGDPRVELPTESKGRGKERANNGFAAELVFDFTGLHRPGLRDLSLILTARLQSGPDERVWVRALPLSTWSILQALGLDHMFHLFPGPGELRN